MYMSQIGCEPPPRGLSDKKDNSSRQCILAKISSSKENTDLSHTFLKQSDLVVEKLFRVFQGHHRSTAFDVTAALISMTLDHNR